jgi:hypothetical protein
MLEGALQENLHLLSSKFQVAKERSSGLGSLTESRSVENYRIKA